MADYNDKNIAGYPSPLAPVEEKNKKEYGLKYARAIWAEYMYLNTTYSQRLGRYILNRKYAEGLQSVQKYKDLLGIEGDTSYLNLDFNPPPVIPKFVDIKVGQLINQPYKIQLTPIDYTSQTKQDDYRRKILTNMKLKPISDQLEQTTGIPLIAKDEPVPESTEEAELYMQLNYKSAESVAIEQALEWVRDNNEWKRVEEKVIRDLVVCKIGAVRTFYDHMDNIRYRYVDVVDLLVPYSKEDDFKNIPHFGEKTYISIHDLAQMNTEFTEEQLFEIARNSAGRYGNGNWRWGERYYAGNSLFGMREWGHFRVQILDFEFITTNTLYYRKSTDENGRMYFDKKNGPVKLPEGSDKQAIEKRVKNKYAGKWIIGTDYLFEYGRVKNEIHEKVKGSYSPETMLSLTVIAPDIYDMENKSLVERMIPFGDQIALCHLKMQQILGKLSPAGTAYDLSGLQGVVLGMGKGAIKDKDSVEMHSQTGKYVYSSQRPDGTLINGKPIETIDNGIGVNASAMQSLIALYQYNVSLIRDVTGINEVADASTPDPKALIGTSKLALMASNNATRTLNNTYISIIERSSKQLILMIQDSIENENEAFTRAIGGEAAKLIELGKDIPVCEFGIKVEFLPDEEEKAEVNQLLQLEIGGGGLRSEDAILIRNVMKTNVKAAAQMLILRKKKYQEERMLEAKQNSELQSQGAIEAANAKAQGDAALLQEEASTYAYKKQMDTESQIMIDNNIHRNRMEELAMELGIKGQNAKEVEHVKNEGKLKQTAFNNATATTPVAQ